MTFFLIIFIVHALYWIILVIFGLNRVRRILDKYQNIRPVQAPQQWKGIIRTDFANWDRKQILYGAIIRLPLNLIIITYILLTGFLSLPFVIGIDKLFPSYYFGIRIYRQLLRKWVWFLLNRLSYKIQQQSFQQINTPLIVSNHVCWFQILYMIIRICPLSFVAKDDVNRIPIIGAIARYQQALFVSRGNQNNREDILQKIEKRVQKYKNRSSDNEVFPVVIFPQGTTSNGYSLIKFKIGAFTTKSPLTMACLKYQCKGFHMGMDQITQGQHALLSLCLSPTLKVKYQKIYPLENESDQQYMYRCKIQMSKILNFKCYECGFRDKQQYLKLFLNHKKN